MNRLGVLSVGVALILGACSSDTKKATSSTAADDTVAVTSALDPAGTASVATAGGAAETTVPATADANGAGGGSTGASGDPCVAVTAADVEAAFGGTATDGVLNDNKDGCDYDITGTTKTGEAGITFVSITVGGGYISFDDEKKGIPDVVKVDGVGNAAWYFAAASQLHIDVGGGKEIVISGNLPGDKAAIQAEVIEFGKVVVAKVG